MPTITLRTTAGEYTPTSPAGTYTQKGAPLTLLEVDQNFDRMNAAVEQVQVNAEDFSIAVAIALG